MIQPNYFVVLILFFFVTLSSCKKSDTGENDPSNAIDRTAMLTYMADDIILPGYSKFKVKLDEMIIKSNAFTTTPTETSLTEFREAWVNAYVEWQKVEMFDVGPADSYGLRFFFNIYPSTIHAAGDYQGIVENIESGNANLGISASYTAQGFPALDYLINGIGSTDTDILTYYTTDADAAKRKAYITKITTQMNSKLTNVMNQWQDSYRTRFIERTGLDISSSTSVLVNGIVLHYERYIRSGKFGIPSGAMLNGTPKSAYVEAYYKKDLSLTLAKTAHQAYIDFFNGKSVLTGTEGPSLKNYLNALDAKDSQTGQSLSTILNTQFVNVNDKMNLLGPNFKTEVETNNAAMKAVYTELQKAVRLLKVDMTSAMSITITYTDNDGD